MKTKLSKLNQHPFVLGLVLGVTFFFLIAAATGNIRWTQLRSGDRHGNGTQGQSSDGTGTSGNYPKYDANGNLTDGVDATNASNLSSGTLPAGRMPALTGDVTSSAGGVATTIAANAVTSAKMAVVNTRRVCSIVIGADNSSAALANADIAPQGRQCEIPYAATVVQVTVAGDAGTPNVIVAKNHAGTLTDLLSGALATASAGALACSNTGGTTGLDGATTCSSTLQNTSIAAGDWIETHSATAGGTAKRMSISVIYTVN